MNQIMKIKIKYAVVLAELFLSLYSCEFSPSEVPMTEIEKPSEIPPAIWIDLRPEMDTLRLSSPVWVYYSIEAGNRQVYRIELQMDEADIVNKNFESDKKVSAYIPTNSLEDGMHELKITTYIATNSGSIADKFGAEVYWYEIRWPVYVNKNAKENFKFNNLEIVPEGIKTSWPEYRYADFSRYEFYRSTFNYQNGMVNITDPRQNSYIDNTYVEGCYTTYTVYVYYTVGSFQYDNMTYHEKIKNPVVKINDDCSVDISWTPSKYEQNVSLYCIRTTVPKYGIQEEHDLTDLNDTTLRLSEKIGFGGDYQVQLRYIPKDFIGYHTILDVAGGLTNFALGDSIPRFLKAFYITEENALLIYRQGVFSKYNYLTGENYATIAVPSAGSGGTVSSSPDGNYFGYFENREYVIRNTSDYATVKTLSLEAYEGNNCILIDISISNNGLIATADDNNNLRIYNMATEGKIFDQHFSVGYYLRRAIISPDGRNLAVILNDYSLGTTSLVYFSFDSGQLNELGRVHGVGQDYGAVMAYAPQDRQKFIVSRWRSMYDYNVEVRDSRTFELLYYVEVPHFFVPVAYDFASDRVVTQYRSFPLKKFSYLIDIQSGNQKKIVQFTGDAPLSFAGEIVFSGNGRSIRIDDFIIE